MRKWRSCPHCHDTLFARPLAGRCLIVVYCCSSLHRCIGVIVSNDSTAITALDAREITFLQLVDITSLYAKIICNNFVYLFYLYNLIF